MNIILKYNEFLSTSFLFCIFVIQPGTSSGYGETGPSAVVTPMQEPPFPDFLPVRDLTSLSLLFALFFRTLIMAILSAAYQLPEDCII
jgi:hypothetical protein